eukprot:760652-Hanusia_phi.AAC.2
MQVDWVNYFIDATYRPNPDDYQVECSLPSCCLMRNALSPLSCSASSICDHDRHDEDMANPSQDAFSDFCRSTVVLGQEQEEV